MVIEASGSCAGRRGRLLVHISVDQETEIRQGVGSGWKPQDPAPKIHFLHLGSTSPHRVTKSRPSVQVQVPVRSILYPNNNSRPVLMVKDLSVGVRAMGKLMKTFS